MFKGVFHFVSADLVKDCNDTFEAFRNEAKMNCDSCVCGPVFYVLWL